MPFLLAERAHSESARSMRTVKGSLGHSLQERCKESEGPRWTAILSIPHDSGLSITYDVAPPSFSWSMETIET